MIAPTEACSKGVALFGMGRVRGESRVMLLEHYAPAILQGRLDRWCAGIERDAPGSRSSVPRRLLMRRKPCSESCEDELARTPWGSRAGLRVMGVGCLLIGAYPPTEGVAAACSSPRSTSTVARRTSERSVRDSSGDPAFVPTLKDREGPSGLAGAKEERLRWRDTKPHRRIHSLSQTRLVQESIRYRLGQGRLTTGQTR